MTVTNYQTLSGALGIIADKPSAVLVCSGGSSWTTSSTNKVSGTGYLYDGGTTSNVAVVGTHDETLLYAGSPKPRGNVPPQIGWISGGTSPTTTYSYDKTGQVTSSTDGCGNASCSDMTGSNHTTHYYYTDAYTTLS